MGARLSATHKINKEKKKAHEKKIGHHRPPAITVVIIRRRFRGRWLVGIRRFCCRSPALWLLRSVVVGSAPGGRGGEKGDAETAHASAELADGGCAFRGI